MSVKNSCFVIAKIEYMHNFHTYYVDAVNATHWSSVKSIVLSVHARVMLYIQDQDKSSDIEQQPTAIYVINLSRHFYLM